ncbi:MAG: ATPase domain-containing protein [Candidatus Helarchaeota archaeon]
MDETRIISFKTKTYPTVVTGIALLDQILLGGFRRDSLIHFYGMPGAGKSTFAMIIAINIMKQGWKAIWVDCNGSFSIPRFQELLSNQQQLIKALTCVHPKSFHLQTKIIHHLSYHLDRVGIIVVDPITHYYRAERFKEGSHGFFHELIDKQLGTLTGICHSQKIPIIVINYGTFTQEGYIAPLVAQGFARMERYRFLFTNIEDDYNLTKQVLIEEASDPYSRDRRFSFCIGRHGFESIQLLPKGEKGD